MKLILINEGETPDDKNIYIRTLTDDDGDVEVQVANNSQFTSNVRVGFFSIDDGKVKFMRYSGLTSQLVSLDDGEIEIG